LVIFVKLSEANELLAQVRAVIPVAKRFDGVAVRIVASAVFGRNGDYNLAVKISEVDDEVLGKIASIADRQHLVIKPTGDYWVIDRLHDSCEHAIE
jgi:2,3-bisphosphoglycerate-independent phosphoglycerate mutase